MNQTVLGTIQGDTIKLAHPLSLADGQQVEIVVRPVEKLDEKRPWGEGLQRCAGIFADHPEMDAVMDEIYLDRQRTPYRDE